MNSISGDAINTSAITFTRFTTKNGEPCGKRVWLDDAGNLQKESLAHRLNFATQERVTVDDAAGFAAVLDSLKLSQALAYGVADEDFASIVTRKASDRGAKGITRTRDNFAYPEGPGVLMLDYDPKPGTEPLPKPALLALVGEFCPEPADAAQLWRPSTSSCIYRKDGTEVRGITGQRLYLLVKDATDIPRAGAMLHARCWLAGHGYFLVSKSGALLERGPFDSVVWQPERLDFCGGADCGEGITQTLPPTEVYGGDALLDTRAALPDLTETEQARFDSLRREARAAIEPEQERTRETYINKRAPTIAKTAGVELEQVERILRVALEQSRLLADFVLHTAPGETVTVGELLDDPEKYHGCGFLDPLEPEYQPNNYRIARVNFYGGGRPFIWSFAHGGRRYTLHRQPRTVHIEAGDLPGVCDRSLDVLRVADPVLFQRGTGAESELVSVTDGHVIPVCHIQLRDRIGRAVRFTKYDGRSKDNKPTDCPTDVAVMIHRRRGAYGLRELKGVSTAPTLRADGSLLNRPGYDQATGLLLLNPTGADFSIPMDVNQNALRRTLGYLWYPFGKFPLAGKVDRSVLLSGLLTAAIRRSLPTAPGFLWDASTAGSGKTLLASCIGCMATGIDPDPQAYPESNAGEDEIKKTLFAALRASDGVLLLDNIEGTLRSAALAALLTKPTYTDRVLGESRRVTVQTNVLLLATGNGVQVQGDLNRRLLRCTINPEMERPDLRSFAFDPLAMVKRQRIDMVRAALLLIRAYLNSGAEPAPGRMASFETWDRLVRQTVCWLAGQFPDFELTDPLEAITTAYGVDPEKQRLAAVLFEWHNAFGSEWKTLRDVRRYADESGYPASPSDKDLREALLEVAGDKGKLESRRLSWYARRFNGRIVDGLSFERDSGKDIDQWRVVTKGLIAPVTPVTPVSPNANVENGTDIYTLPVRNNRNNQTNRCSMSEEGTI